ncbi:MAG: HAMP domain-containing histidine kinase [Eubacterium sp.]|nr:HAMP domain-containing histidine kinase [Eubacterium sp.]
MKTVKAKIAAWMTLLTAFLAVLLVVFMIAISSSVAVRTAAGQLEDVVRSNLGQVRIEQGKPQMDSGFRFYQNGVSTFLYSKKKALLAGQLPVSFVSAAASEPFRNGVVRMVDAGEVRYLLLDLWLAADWENGVWIRGLVEAPENSRSAYNLLKVAMIVLPVFMALAAAGSYWIIRRALRPLDSINATAAAINEARDLSRRIGLAPGQDEFSRLGSEFDHLFERLERSFEAEKQFTADASHELRTPVSIIKGACDYALKYDETEEDRQETLDMIKRQAEKMSVVISQLLSMTRLEQGTEQAGMERVELYGFLRSLCREQAYDTERVLVTRENETDAEPGCGTDRICVQANPALLSRLVINLVENALKYGRTDGHVWLSVQRCKQEVQLHVTDDGDGIAAEYQEKVWQRFYQVDSAHSGDLGAGLGLPMVRQIAQLHGGYMTLASEPGRGCTFTLHLPESLYV